MVKSSYSDRLYPTILFVVSMFFLTVYTYYPGILTSDSIGQLAEAKTRLFTDLHAPGMAFLWSLLNRLYFFQASMLVLNNLLFWMALGLFSFYLFPKSNLYRIILVFLLGIFPPIFTQLGVILEDIPCFSLLFLVCILLLFIGRITKNWMRFSLMLIVILLLFSATLMRHNAIIAAIPICFWIVNLVIPGDKKIVKIKILFFGVLFFGLLFTANKVFVNSLVQGRTYYPSQMFKIYDLIGVSVTKKVIILPQYIIKKYHPTVNELTRSFIYANGLYSQTNINYAAIDYAAIDYWDLNRVNIRELDRLWAQTILQNPLAYMKHRLMIFACLCVGGSQYSYFLGPNANAIGFYPNYIFNLYYKFANLFVFDLNFLQKIYNSYHPMTKVKPHPVHLYILFFGGFYWFICLFVSIGAFISRKRLENFEGIFYISLSGFLYGAGYIFCAPTDEYRYWLWTVVAAIMSLSLFIKERFFIKSKNHGLV